MLFFFCFKQEAGYHAEALAISYDFGGREVFAAGRGLAAASQVARRREVITSAAAAAAAAAAALAPAAAVALSAPVASANSCRPRVLLPPDADALGTLIAP